MIEYKPQFFVKPKKMIDVPTAWDGCEYVIADVIDQFRIRPLVALEFGVDYAYSTVALSNYFDFVFGVDTFMGDINAGDRGKDGIFRQVKESLKGFPNITLIPQSFQEFTEGSNGQLSVRYDLIHVDIVHDYDSTYGCGQWAVRHSDVVMFHDTIAFADVMKAVKDLANERELNFYQWPVKHGLGILSRRKVR
jgi:hypothetical protein